MEYCNVKNSIVRKVNDDCTITEYPINSNKINIASVEIHGRYPQTGYAVNREVDELVFITNGNGSITQKNKTLSFTAGDTILIEPNEVYFWSGNFTATIACTPAFTAHQHEYIDFE